MTDPNAVKLMVMRRGLNRGWTLLCGLALAGLLAAAYHPGFGANRSTGMSVPSAPRTAIDSPPLHQILRSHFDVSASEPTGAGRPFPEFAASVANYTGRTFWPACHYGPLHLRPPPSLFDSRCY